MKKVRKWWHRPCAYMLHKMIWLYIKTLRVTFSGRQYLETGGAVFLLWHEYLILTPLFDSLAFVHPLQIFISNSRDGDLPTEIASYYHNVFVIRVKHRNRSIALRAACQALERGESLFIAADGPRGPRRSLKIGTLYAAQRTKVPVIPIAVQVHRAIRFSSWDRFCVPLPFSRVHISFCEPEYVTEQSVEEWKESIEEKISQAEQSMSI